MRFDLGCALYAQNVAIVLPQTHGPGCGEFVITFALALSPVIHKYFSPVLPWICLAGCYDFTTTCISVFSAMLHGFACVDLGTRHGQGRKQVRFDKFPQGGKSPHLGQYFCGVIEPTAKRRSNSHQ